MQDDEDFIAFHVGINRHALMYDVYMENFTNWQEAGGTLFMHFVDIGEPGRYGSWGALEHVTQESSPRWNAIMEFNDTTCWWEGC